MTLLRRVLGETLRGQRLRQRRTLREVSGAARVSLGYLSEVERGQKEASSELLASICAALDVRLSEVLREVSDTMRRTERAAGVARAPARQLVPAGAPSRPDVRGPVELPVGGDGAELPVDFEVPDDFDPAELVDRVSLDTARGPAPVLLPGQGRRDTGPLDTEPVDTGPLDTEPLDSGSRGTGSLDIGSLGTDRPDSNPSDPGRLTDARRDRAGSGNGPGADGLDPDRLRIGHLDADRLDADHVDAGHLDAVRPEDDHLDADRLTRGAAGSDRREDRDRRLERIGLDGVDLAELETGDGLGDVDTLLSLTDLSCCLDRPHGVATCLAGTTVAA